MKSQQRMERLEPWYCWQTQRNYFPPRRGNGN